MVVNAAVAMAGDSDALKAIMKMKSYDEAKALVTSSSLGSLANNEEKAKAYNKLVDLAMEKVQHVLEIMNANSNAERMGTGMIVDYDPIAFYDALGHAFVDANECINSMSCLMKKVLKKQNTTKPTLNDCGSCANTLSMVVSSSKIRATWSMLTSI